MSYWMWLIAGLILLSIELIAPVTYFLWLGGAAFITAASVFVVPNLTWQIQIVIFSVLAVIGFLISRKYIKNKVLESEAPQFKPQGAAVCRQSVYPERRHSPGRRQGQGG